MTFTVGAAMTKHRKQPKPTTLTAGLALAGIALAFTSCDSWKAKDAFTALQIVQVQAMTSNGTSCTVPGTASESSKSQGTLDVYLPDNSFPPYVLPLLVVNNLDSAGGSKATEMNNITLSHFTTTLSAPGMTWTSSCPATFDSEPFSILLTPGGGATGYAMKIIEQQHSICLAAALNPQPADQYPRHVLVTASVKAVGRHGGTTVESAPFIYTVDVCTGCLQDDYTDPALLRYNYNAGYPACNALSGTNPYPGDACLPPGQDFPILCCGYVDASGKQRAICPAVIPTSTKTSTDTSTSTTTSTGTATNP
jgi:hypothetical protein